ncbi:MAG: primase-helicase family protein [Bdellovibrio sp.]
MPKIDAQISQGEAQLETVLDLLKIKIVKYDPLKQRPVSTNKGTMNLEKFANAIRDGLGPRGAQYSEVLGATYDFTVLEVMLEQYALSRGILISKGLVYSDVPDDLKGLRLNFDMSSKSREDKFFLTDDNEQISRISGDTYLMVHQLSQNEAVSQARSVIPEYLPRKEPGVFVQKVGRRTETIFNSYAQPSWFRFENLETLPNTPPPLVKKLLDHLFVNPTDQEYFLDWAYASLFNRAPVFLVLCGDPGIGKNRLKLLLRALHGHENSIDGKRSTITEKFNGQISSATLVWFDELKYDIKMENTMKELPNDTLAIERKGIDATRGTKVYASFVISNNKTRDNYISFDSRKFAPLSLTKKRLEESMTSKEVDLLSQKLEDFTSPTYDLAFIAQTAQWLRSRGSTGRWPNLEYRGPMFWHLAHTSMPQYQKRVIAVLDEYCSDGSRHRPGWDHELNGFRWSVLCTALLRRSEFKDLRFPDFSTVQFFIEGFRDKNGGKVFETSPVEGPNILGDFWIKPLGLFKAESPIEKLTRPPGMRPYQWKKMQEEQQALQGKRLKDVFDDL